MQLSINLSLIMGWNHICVFFIPNIKRLSSHLTTSIWPLIRPILSTLHNLLLLLDHNKNKLISVIFSNELGTNTESNLHWLTCPRCRNQDPFAFTPQLFSTTLPLTYWFPRTIILLGVRLSCDRLPEGRWVYAQVTPTRLCSGWRGTRPKEWNWLLALGTTQPCTTRVYDKLN